MTIERKTTTSSYLESLLQLSRKEDIHGANFEFIIRGKERAKENTYKWVSSGITCERLLYEDLAQPELRV
jgi:hypothetical protein